MNSLLEIHQWIHYWKSTNEFIVGNPPMNSLLEIHQWIHYWKSTNEFIVGNPPMNSLLEIHQWIIVGNPPMKTEKSAKLSRFLMYGRWDFKAKISIIEKLLNHKILQSAHLGLFFGQASKICVRRMFVLKRINLSSKDYNWKSCSRYTGVFWFIY